MHERVFRDEESCVASSYFSTQQLTEGIRRRLLFHSKYYYNNENTNSWIFCTFEAIKTNSNIVLQNLCHCFFTAKISHDILQKHIPRCCVMLLPVLELHIHVIQRE